MKEKIIQYIKDNRITFSILLDVIGFVIVVIIGSFLISEFGSYFNTNDKLFILGAIFGILCYDFIYFLICFIVDVIRFFLYHFKKNKNGV